VVNKSPLELGLILTGQCLFLPPARVKRVILGNLTTVDFLDHTTRAWRADGAGVPTKIPFMLTLPEATADAPVPVAVFGHGLTIERRLSILASERLARAGIAMMAIDFPLHGERTLCLEDGHCENGATCAADGVCLKDGKKADLARYPTLWPGLGGGIPQATGAGFIDVPNLFATRDHFRQAFVDLSTVTRLLRNMDWRPVTGGVALDPSRLHYVGISLGSIIGAGAGGMDPSYSRMYLSVGGAGLVDVMRESGTFGDTLRKGLAEKGIFEGTPEYDAFLNASTWVMDEVDPIQDDNVVPNSATRRLVKATGMNPDTNFSTYPGTHSVLLNVAEPSFCPVQTEMAGFLETP
jgi:hypothetical protein